MISFPFRAAPFTHTNPIWYMIHVQIDARTFWYTHIDAGEKRYIIVAEFELYVGQYFEWTLLNILLLCIYFIRLMLFSISARSATVAVSYCFCIPSQIVFIYVK